ncbi:MAG: response regulator [Comamonadaceae bacterium]|nr:MAG: response regulator [Comamonadaceae bacterium]
MLTRSNSPALRILVADDSAEASDLLAEFLRARGHSVRVEYDGESAAEAALLERFDVAVLDIEMPLLDGWELARSIRSRAPDTLLYAVSGLAEAGAVERSGAAGFDDHFRKPVGFPALVDRIERWALGRSATAQTDA